MVWSRVYRRVREMTTPLFVTGAVAMIVICLAAFSWRRGALVGGDRLLDGRTAGYSPADVVALFNAMPGDHRQLYGWTELTLDVVFPLSYGALALILTARLWSARAAWLLAIVIVAPVADMAENACVAYLAFSFDGRESPVALVGSAFTCVKWAALAVTGGVVLVGLARVLTMRLFDRGAR